MDQVEMIRRSLRCFAFGLIGVLPGIGIPFAVVALGDFLYVSQNREPILNPAARYLRWGAFIAIAGLLLSLFLAGLVAIQLWWGR